MAPSPRPPAHPPPSRTDARGRGVLWQVGPPSHVRGVRGVLEPRERAAAALQHPRPRRERRRLRALHRRRCRTRLAPLLLLALLGLAPAPPRGIMHQSRGHVLILRRWKHHVLTDEEWDHGLLTRAAGARAVGQVEALVFGNYVWEKLKMEAPPRPPPRTPRTLSPLRPGALLPGGGRAVSCLTFGSLLGCLRWFLTDAIVRIFLFSVAAAAERVLVSRSAGGGDGARRDHGGEPRRAPRRRRGRPPPRVPRPGPARPLSHLLIKTCNRPPPVSSLN